MHVRVHRIGYQGVGAASIYGFMGVEWTERDGWLNLSQISFSLPLYLYLYVLSLFVAFCRDFAGCTCVGRRLGTAQRSHREQVLGESSSPILQSTV